MKVINDPLYGFIEIKSRLLFDIINHPYVQRLRHIRQLGLADLIYPGALHTRFQHALGAMHLTEKALDILRAKGVDITESEYEATMAAVLLHDLGHGPFSHALENEILQEIQHESISYLLIKDLNHLFDHALDLTLAIFRNSYKRKFLHQLVSSQLDMDRLDYLSRDCFFTGVMEGKIGLERILLVLNVHGDELVVEEKGMYSIENFLTARRLMYWQVYLHKTAVSAERLMVNVIRRAKHLLRAGENVICSESLKFFLNRDWRMDDLQETGAVLENYCRLDDNDIMGAVKMWMNHSDPILSLLTTMLVERRLFRIHLSLDPIEKETVDNLRKKITDQYGILNSETTYLMSHGTVSNEAYAEGDVIHVLTRKGELTDVADASDLPNIQALGKIVKKNYLCWPKNVSL